MFTTPDPYFSPNLAAHDHYCKVIENSSLEMKFLGAFEKHEFALYFANPQRLNRFAYVQNNPINFNDPLGLILTLGQNVWISTVANVSTAVATVAVVTLVPGNVPLAAAVGYLVNIGVTAAMTAYYDGDSTDQLNNFANASVGFMASYVCLGWVPMRYCVMLDFGIDMMLTGGDPPISGNMSELAGAWDIAAANNIDTGFYSSFSEDESGSEE